MVMDPRLPESYKPNEPVVGFDSFTLPLLSIEPDALNNMPMNSTENPDGESVFPAEPDRVCFHPSVSVGTDFNVGREWGSSLDDCASSDPVLKYISQMLMEENMEETAWTNPDLLALQNMEKSLHDTLADQCPDLPDKFDNFDTGQLIGRRNSSLFGSSSKKSDIGAIVATTSCNNSIDPNWLHDPVDHSQTITSVVHPVDQAPQLNLNDSSPFYASSLSNSIDDTNRLVQSPFLVKNKNVFNDNDSVMQFKRGFEEASKFLPPSSQLRIDFENVRSGSMARGGIRESKGNREDASNGSISTTGRKNNERKYLVFEEARASKQFATCVESEETELSDMLDKVLLCTEKVEFLSSNASSLSTDASKDLQTSAQLCGSKNGRGWGSRRGSTSSSSEVDLRALLIMCAQAISSNDLRTSNEMLKQIRKHSSPSGDGSQRLAHHFANGLEARMAGLTPNLYASFFDKWISDADILKAHQLDLSCCPFRRLSIFYMNYMIWKLSQQASVLHIINFGIAFGFQFPLLIQKLGERDGGPPKLRITGIEFPQSGFRPGQRIERTGRLLARYCDHFNVPFEYNALLSRNWEATKIEDLKIRSGEMIAVNYLTRFEYLLDETVEKENPRDAMLDLIRRIKPDVFVHSITNGSYSAPFFVTRFREALLHMSSIYDMLDATVPVKHKDSEERTILESQVYGPEIMNVVACEGSERVVRPETYKQWQARHQKAGFRQLPLDREIMQEFRQKLEEWYHEDFVLDVDGDWMLMGWKGRILYAISCWVPI